jgi:adenylate cyclase
MGDGVNVASRLEGKNKEYGTMICISDSVLQEVGDLVITRPLGATRVKGRRHEILIHELLGISHYDDSDFAAF